MAGVVHGNDVMFLVNNGTNYVPFVCAKDVTIETATSLVSVVTIGDGIWEKFAPQSLGYSLTLTGVLKFDTANFSAWDLINHQHQFVDIEYKMIFKDQELSNIKTVKGRALVERSSLTGNYGQFSQTSFSLKGNGAYIFINCDVAIGSLAISKNEDDETLVTIQDVEGDAASFIYTFNNGFEQTTTGTVINLGVLPGGKHSIIVTPVCENEERGDEIEHDFLIVIPVTDNPLKPNPTDLNFTDVSSTSFTLTWSQIGQAIGAVVTVMNTSTNHSFSINVNDSPITVNNLTPETEYQITVQASYGSGLSAGAVVFTTTEAAGNAPGQDTYTHELEFSALNTASTEGVTATIGEPNAVVKLEFDAIPGYTGTVHTMTLFLGRSFVMVVQFANSYMGQPFRYTHSNGQAFSLNFTAGTLFLT